MSEKRSNCPYSGPTPRSPLPRHAQIPERSNLDDQKDNKVQSSKSRKRKEEKEAEGNHIIQNHESNSEDEDNTSVDTSINAENQSDDDDESLVKINKEESYNTSTEEQKKPINSTPKTQDQRICNKGITISVVLSSLFVSLLVTFFTSYAEESSNNNFYIDIKQEFPSQDDNLWIAFESGVNDVITLEKPSTFILLYQPQAQKTLNELLPKLSEYAICQITTNCTQKPVEITNEELNSPEVLKNYGIIIEKYKQPLITRGVMIVKNLESIPGISAQVFHSICDEFTPLVAKSLIIFTMQVNEDFPSEDKMMKFVEDFYRNKWTDIKTDTFNALITRITSMVLQVKA